MGDFYDKTDYLTETKGLLKDRINSLGGSITSGTTFRDYLVWLDSLYEALDEKTITGLPDSLEGKCEQEGTPTPSSPQPINITTGRQVVSVSNGTTTNDYEINLGKNLFNIANGTYTSGNVSAVVDNNVITINGTSGSSASTIAIPFTITLDGTYTFSAYNSAIGTSSNWTGMRLKQTSSSTISSTQMAFKNANEYKTFTLSNTGVQYFELRLGTSTTFDNYVITPQLEKGTGTSYAPYKTPIYLGKIGTYQDYIFKNTTENPYYDSNLEEGQWYIHKEVGKVVLDSTNHYAGGTTGTNAYYLSTNISDGANDNSKELSMSNMFKPCSFNARGNGLDITYVQSSRLTLRTANNTSIDWSTGTARQNWLNANKPTCYYVLNTPTNTLIEDEELINQLNEIEIFTVISEDFYN